MIQFQHTFRMAIDRCTDKEIILTGRNNYIGIVLRATLTALAITAGFIFLAIWSGGFPLVSLLSILGTVTALSAWFSMLGSLRSRTYGKERIEFRRQVIRYTHDVRGGKYTALSLENYATCKLLIDGQSLRFFTGEESAPRFEFSIDQRQHGGIDTLALRLMDVTGLSLLRQVALPTGKLLIAGNRQIREVSSTGIPPLTASDRFSPATQPPMLVLIETADKIIVRGNPRLKVSSNELTLYKEKNYIYIRPLGLIGKPFDIRTIASFRYSVQLQDYEGVHRLKGSLFFETAQGNLIEAITYTHTLKNAMIKELVLDEARENLKYIIQELTARVKELQLAAIARKKG